MKTLITVKLEKARKGGSYSTSDLDLAIIREVEDKYGDNARWFKDGVKSSDIREFGVVEFTDSSGRVRRINTYIDIAIT